MSDMRGAAVEAGLRFLWDEREEDGWWRDFWTPAGVADEWVTAYVGEACAQLGPSGLELAHTAWRQLVSRPREDGWGYHDGVPGDADSTLWALRLGERLGLGGSRRADGARRFLAEHRRAGGFTTYADGEPIRAFMDLPPELSFTGWCASHACVSAAALPLADDPAALWHELLPRQRDDGSWGAYWWLDDAYATGTLIESLSKLGDLGSADWSADDVAAVKRAVDWCARRLGRELKKSESDISPFVVAWCVRGLAAGGNLVSSGTSLERQEAVDKGRQALIRLQKKHGGWQATARLRVPLPPDDTPDLDSGGRPRKDDSWQRWLGLGAPLQGLDDKLGRTFNLFSIDQNGIFTTATVLVALGDPADLVESTSRPRGLGSGRGGLDPFSDAFKQDPYPCYERLRRDAPVSWIDSLDAWGISRFEDVQMVLKDFKRFSSSVQASMDQPLLATDPPEHTRIRRVLARCFSSSRLAAFHTSFERRADALVTDLEAAGGGDLVADLTRPLTRTMASELLDIPDARQGDFMRWADDMVDLYTRLAFAGGDPSQRLAEVGQSLVEIREFFLDEHLPRRAAAGQGLLAELVRDDRGRDVLSFEEALSFAKLFLVAGTETSRNLLGNTVAVLLDHAGEIENARRDPERVPALIEESMRFDSAVQLVLRRAAEDVDLGGRKIEAGDKIAVLLGSANRDERVFKHPKRFDPRRSEKHIALGTGPHYCLGAHLARIEAAALVRRMIRSDKRWQAREPVADAERIPSYVLRGPERLGLSLT